MPATLATHPAWRGVRLRTVHAGADADAAPRPVTLPASWPDSAAAGLAALIPGTGPINLPDAASAWIEPATLGDGALAQRLHRALLLHRAAPDAATWRATSSNAPGFTLNLPAFVTPEDGFDVAAFAQAAADAATCLIRAHPRAPKLAIGMADLFGLFARAGIDPEAPTAAAAAACLASLLRATVDTVSAAGRPGPAAAWPEPPRACPIPGLAAAAGAAAYQAGGLRPAHAATTAIGVPGAECAVLGVEAGGVEPPFGPLDADGRLSRAARARLSRAGLSPEAALAALYRGQDPLAPPTDAAVRAIADAVAEQVHAMPPRHAGVLGFAPPRVRRPSAAPPLPLNLPEPASQPATRRRASHLA